MLLIFFVFFFLTVLFITFDDIGFTSKNKHAYHLVFNSKTKQYSLIILHPTFTIKILPFTSAVMINVRAEP